MGTTDATGAGTALTVVNRLTGEIIEDIKAADTETLARFEDAAQAAIADVGVARDLVNAELIARLDRRANWTLRVGEPTDDFQLEIKVPSPTARTATYPEQVLEHELRGLVERGTIDEDGAASALDRTLVVTFSLPLRADLDAVAAEMSEGLTLTVTGTPCKVKKAEPRRRTIVAGINALRKVPGTSSALDRAKNVGGAPPRKATVKRITRKR